jgi:hypothetical protein
VASSLSQVCSRIDGVHAEAGLKNLREGGIVPNDSHIITQY